MGMPMVYGVLYNRHPSAPWVLAAAFSVAGEAVFATLSAADIAAVESEGSKGLGS